MNNLCLATNYLLMTESSRQMWIELDRHLDEFGSRLVLLSSAVPETPLPFPVIPIPFLLRDYAGWFPGAATGGHVSAGDLELLQADSQRANHDYPPGEALTGMFACRQLLATVLDELQPGYVLTWDPTSPMAHLLQSLARAGGLPVLGIERGLLPETLMVESRSLQGYSDLRTHWLAQEMPASAADAAAYERVRAYYLSGRPQKYDQPEFGGGGDALRRCLGLEGKKVIVYLGQYDACGLAPKDSNHRRQHSPVFDSTAAALTEVGNFLPGHPGVAVVFKPHPLDKGAYPVAKVQGVQLVRDVNVHALIEMADVVAAQFTTLQFEAALYEKPVVLLGRSAWWGRNAAYEADDRDAVPARLEAALERRNWPAHQAAAHGFITWMMDQFLIGCSENVPARRKLRDFAGFIARTSLDSRHLATAEERWMRTEQALEELRANVPATIGSDGTVGSAPSYTKALNGTPDVARPALFSSSQPTAAPTRKNYNNGQGVPITFDSGMDNGKAEKITPSGARAVNGKSAMSKETPPEQGEQSPIRNGVLSETRLNPSANGSRMFQQETIEPPASKQATTESNGDASHNEPNEPRKEAPDLTDLHIQAKTKAAAGDLAGAFHLYRQMLAASTTFTDEENAALAKEIACLLPRWLQGAQPAETSGLVRALRLHPRLAGRFALALEEFATREAAALTFALGATYFAANRPLEARSLLTPNQKSGIVSPQFNEGFEELRAAASANVEASQAGGWAVQRPTPYPLAADGKPKLNPVWFEVTSFCNQKCSFCPDQWRQAKRQFIDLDVFKRYVDELRRDFHVEYLQLNAYGEPLLHPNFEQILTYLRNGNAPSPFFFTTHGMTLNERNIAMLDRAHPHGICVSLQNDGEESYALSRDSRIGNYAKLAAQTRNLIERFVQNRRACHVRLYQLVRNGKEGWGVPERVLQAFPPEWKRFAAAVRSWEESLRPLADGRNVQAVRNTDDQIREAFEQADHPAWWVKLDLLRWKDERGGEQTAFISPRPVGTYANQLPHHTPGWAVKQQILNPGGCCFTRTPGLAIFSNGNLGVCCLSVDQNASFGRLQDFGSLKDALTSEACFRFFAELSNGVARSRDCQICLGQIERTGDAPVCASHECNPSHA